MKNQLTINLCSFSFKKGLPVDGSGNGGGFILDCRFLPNPGRQVKYKTLTGNDDEVIAFFQQYLEMEWFIQHNLDMFRPVIENYKERKFTDLQISFGCTGGQHRSVYCANAVFEGLKEHENIVVKLSHRELDAIVE